MRREIMREWGNGRRVGCERESKRERKREREREKERE